ncbi:hypothetical protein MYP_1650 [Sporocytophaga myxococcoides]|uniref:DUF434 domain-containing protein n=1 Tax=Sporocytophaga myxococcoides TaxID=153721 RepID=A0A098LDB8_9BACT|nr:DUF434 domain-containing protein [Sporocytophaga myxococcoides]GAL84422.1 hypothetical protein MYP_1650 [Sporocytophaga myxococcoides]
MPDKRKHRGAHPNDESNFNETKLPDLRNAVEDLSWLLSKKYNEASSLKLVGDRYRLNFRQQMAVRRSCCSLDSLKHRLSMQKSAASLKNADLFIDGFNTLITIESFYSGACLFIGMDGCIRDLASIHGSYKKVMETPEALSQISSFLWNFKPKSVTWYFDAPVSNSGRIKTLLKEISPKSNAELVPDADKQLLISKGIIVTTDGPLLDKMTAWFNLNSDLIHSLPNTLRTKLLNLNPFEISSLTIL